MKGAAVTPLVNNSNNSGGTRGHVVPVPELAHEGRKRRMENPLRHSTRPARLMWVDPNQVISIQPSHDLNRLDQSLFDYNRC